MPDNRRYRKTKTQDQTQKNFDHDSLNQMFDEPKTHHMSPSGSTSNNAPDLSKASPNRARDAMRGISPSDEMRSYLDKLDFDEPDEVDDATAWANSGRIEPDQRPPGTDLVTVDDVPDVIKKAMVDAGYQNPDWFTISTLPGYLSNAIRSMGRSIFKMFTRTRLEDITVIANVQGQGPNTHAELNAVAGWLRKNARDMGDADIDFSRAMPGYSPDIKVYSTDNVRFLVIQDMGGKYIYAFPEEDAVDTTTSIQHD